MTTIETRPADEMPHRAAEATPVPPKTNELQGFEFPRRRRWPFLLLGIVLGVGGTIATISLLGRDGADQGAAAGVDLRLTTAPVETRDLIEEVEWVADLGYGTPVDVTASVDGTVTGTVETGTVLTRGEPLLAIDRHPVIILYGDIPPWRDLTDGDHGPDVWQLETNLVALGYDPDETVTIDDTFTSNTGLMVERWQADLGIEATGDVARRDVIVVQGPVSVTTAPTVGQTARTGTTLAGLSTRASTATVLGPQLGEIAAMIEPGEPVDQGTVLYSAEGVEVMALTSPDSIASMLLDPGTAPADIEAALSFSGYDPDNLMVVDDTYDLATRAAISRWQEANGLPPTGEVSSAAYVLVPPDLQVSRRLVRPGDTIAVARPVLELAAPTLSVVIPVGLADQDSFFVGQEVQIELPDESVVTGTVAEVGTIARASEPDQDPTIDVTVELAELVDEDLPASQVSVVVAGDSVHNALVVPTRALVTLSEGGFAVEKVLADGTTILVSVETGAFDDGVVAVVSSQLETGDELVVPQ